MVTLLVQLVWNFFPLLYFGCLCCLFILYFNFKECFVQLFTVSSVCISKCVSLHHIARGVLQRGWCHFTNTIRPGFSDYLMCRARPCLIYKFLTPFFLCVCVIFEVFAINIAILLINLFFACFYYSNLQ